MPRYMIQRSFPDGLEIPTTSAGRDALRGIVETNAAGGVTWIHSYVNDARTQTFCVYDAPTPEAIREVARNNQLPVDSITEVSVLDPYFYVESAS